MHNLENSFDKIQKLSKQPDTRIYGTGLWGICHDLAEANYPSAKEFFIKELDDPRWDWRRVSVSLLGFHYKLEPQIIEKIRELTIRDPDSGVRIASASVLGLQGKFPEETLIRSLTSDSNKRVREAAFSSLLELSGVPYKTKLKENRRVKNGEIEPSLDQIRRILTDENLSSTIKLLDEK